MDPREWLEGHINLETGVGMPASRRATAPSRERIDALLKYLGSPELEFPAVHITGTNGKTSTARITTQLLLHVGLAVGSFTSPHLERVNERIMYQGESIPDEELDGLLRTVAMVEGELGIDPSWFDILTACAYRWFADLAVDVAVVEVGLGGTWDTTNCLSTRVAVVTNVAIDHVELLGPTRERIAAEKAGIVQPGSTLVLGETDPELEHFFTDRGPAEVLRRDVDFGVRANDLAVGGRLVDLFTPLAAYDELLLPLHGAHQADNAATALATVEAFLGAPLARDIVEDALAHASSPGRLEIVRRQPLVILDGAHNVAGAEALRDALTEEFATGPRTLVVGLLRQKNPHEMLAALGIDEVAHLVCCPPPSGRALDPEELAAAARDLGVDEDHIEVADSVREAVTLALLATPEGGEVVITGSLYVVGEARSILLHK